MTILNDDDSANAELKQTIDVNFMGAVYCTRESNKSMMKRNAHKYQFNRCLCTMWGKEQVRM